MKTLLTKVTVDGVTFDQLAFVCPGCIALIGGTGLHLLPVNSSVKKPSWEWDRNLLRPTLQPSIRTISRNQGVCHSFLRAGVFEFLKDSTHALVGQFCEIPHLPDAYVESHNDPRS